MPKKVKSRAKQVILAIAIALVLSLFIGYGISVFYESPKYETFCGLEPKYAGENVTQVQCEGADGKWVASVGVGEMAPKAVPVGPNYGYCDLYFKCSGEFQKVNDIYNRNVFIICLILGLLVIISGIFLKLESVSTGIMGGGVLLVLYGTMRYWGELGKYLRLAILGLLLAALIWIGYRKFGRK